MLTPALDLALSLDPVILLHLAGLTPDDWQKRVLRSSSQRILLNCSRQSGKSTISAGLAIHTALYKPGSLILLLSPSLRQSQELFRKVLSFYRIVADSIPSDSETRLTLELANGSRVLSLPGKEGTIRGYSGVSLLVVDEAARVADELYYSVRPMLAVSGGRLIALSTPFGTRGWWYEAWRSNEAWERYTITAKQCPRITAEFLEEERRTLGEWWFRQEYECQFLDSQTQAFTHDMVEHAFDYGVETWTL
jgi:hypothetical protein